LMAGGLEEAKKAYENLQNKAKQLENLIVNGNIDPSQIPEEYVDILPLLVTLSLIDMLLLQNILLFDLF